MPVSNEQKDARGQCQVIWFKWSLPIAANSENTAVLSAAKAYDITNYLQDYVVFSKNLGEAAGRFSFKLAPTRDWEEEGMAGSWCLIYMANDGTLNLPEEPDGNKLPEAAKNKINPSKLRAICYIERAPASTETEDNGNVVTEYTVCGKDFGVVYEGTDLWFNYFQMEQTQVKFLAEKIDNSNANTVADLVAVSHDLFFAPGKVIKSKTPEAVQLGEVGTQWLLPRIMLDFIGAKADGPSFYGNIRDLKKFGKTRCRIPIVNPLSYLNGIAWPRLKEFSIPELHELFPELDNDGKPKLIFRTIPWGLNSTSYPRLRGSIGSEIMYRSLVDDPDSRVDITPLDLDTTDLSKDDHNRYNHFFTTSQTSLNVPQANIEILKNRKSIGGREYPHLQKGSVMRHGLRKMHVDLNTFAVAAENPTAENANGLPDANLLLEYNELLYDFWNNAVFFDSGSAVIHGNNSIRLGKVIVFSEDVVKHGGKVFYIEEYQDEFIIEENGVGDWNQILQLTRGIEIADLKTRSGFTRRSQTPKKLASFIKDK